MDTAEALSEEISGKINTWLETKRETLRNAHSDAAWEAVEVKLRKFLNDAGFSDKMIRNSEVNLRECIEDQYMKLYPVAGGFRAPGEAFE